MKREKMNAKANGNVKLNEKNIQSMKVLSLKEMKEINGGTRIPVRNDKGEIIYYIDI